ncbi:DNA primase [Xylanimonas cellulosilytica DSM 15894]|uniref:DNA primase n=1 Tax=Xylanimonas cellulosilytica (strain DSM 15894 / JCM 12276 / CECT 5975 / KCTC 9989 / LMG 20990 / NBRC 107835 / XIL07) TaxID=446471 RepID=D1BUG1_XYLCX|nr:DNA primase [Xylanimonas cellulosilytica]ACZ31174.1 DNA primase [Xylanimonas cellulosilytica DSM 15894]
MAGLIKREDVEAVRERARIEEIVSAHVTLKPAGVGSLKGLCPFHDERTPSFHVRPGVGRYHCFGCGESGDVIAFVQKTDGLGFAEAVEYLADRVGVQLRYEDSRGGDSGPARREEPGRRQRLVEANRVAAEFYSAQLFGPDAAAGRKFLAERSFDRSDAEKFGVGYAPTGWDALTRHLQGKGYTQAELVAAGLVSQGQRGVYDRFRGRLVWPIRDTTGAVVGFGARRLYDDDQGPKFLNTPETVLYKKSQVLYGIDLAKKAIARDKRVVVVEGYADVMAAQLSGVETAVATCGTAFAGDHAKIVRRLMGDFGAGGGLQLASGQSLGGEVIFTFDGDAAGQKAAVRAFGEEQRFHAQTFVAVAADGMDPCDLRIAKGPQAVKALVDSRVPLFEFVIRKVVEGYDLDTVEGRIGALREAAPLVAGIRDRAMQLGYTRSLARWTGMDTDEARREVARAGERPRTPDRSTRAADPVAVVPAPAPTMPLPDPRDPVARTERMALVVVLQYPQHVPPVFDELSEDAFAVPAWRAVHAAIRAAGGAAAGRTMSGGAWVGAVQEQAGELVAGLVDQLAVAPLPEDREDAIARFVADVVRAVQDLGLTRLIADAKSRLLRLDPGAEPQAYREAFQTLLSMEAQRRTLREPA